MEDIELKSIWNAYERKIEKSLKINLKLFENMQQDKANAKLTALRSVKVGGVVAGLLWNLLLGALIYANHFSNIYFCVSLSMLMMFSIIGISSYIRHLVLIRQVDYAESITDAQQKLAQLQVSTISVSGVLWLQMPFYTTFFWNQDWISNGGASFWLIALPVTLLFTAASIWLFRNIRPENIGKPWLNKLMMIGMEYKYAISAGRLLGEIEAFRKDDL